MESFRTAAAPLNMFLSRNTGGLYETRDGKSFKGPSTSLCFSQRSLRYPTGAHNRSSCRPCILRKLHALLLDHRLYRAKALFCHSNTTRDSISEVSSAGARNLSPLSEKDLTTQWGLFILYRGGFLNSGPKYLNE